MRAFILLPIFLGSLTVFQPLLNRVILEERGLSFAAWLNGCVLFLVASLVAVLIYYSGDSVPPHFQLRWQGSWRWWFFLPGLMGFALVFFLPVSMRTLGAFPSIIAFLLGQLLTSFIYDAVTTGQTVSITRILGLIFALIGAYLSFRPTT